MPLQSHDVFISHNSKDKAIAEGIANRLRAEYDLLPWMDNWTLRGGDDWWNRIQRELSTSKSCLVLLSGNGWGAWHEQEAELALKRSEQESSFRIIPVLLPGASEHDATLKKLTATRHWVDLRAGLETAEDFQRLVAAIEDKGEFIGRRAELDIHQFIRDARRWDVSQRKDRSILYSGTELRVAQHIADSHAEEMTVLAMKFLTASYDQQSRTFRNLITGLGIALLLISSAAGVAFYQRNVAQRQTRISDARALAANAQANLESDPELSILLATEAISTTLRWDEPVVPQAEEALHQALLTSQIRVTLQGHAKPVIGVNYSPDGKQVVTASQDGTSKIWDVRTGKAIRSLVGHRFSLYDVTFSPDGQKLVIVGEGGTTEFFDTNTGQPSEEWDSATHSQDHYSTVRGVAFSADGHKLVTASLDIRDRVRVWDTQTNTHLFAINDHNDGVFAAGFSPDGATLVTASADGTAKVWDATTGKELLTLQGHTDRVISAAFSPDGSHIITASWDKTVRLWDAHSGALTATLVGHADKIRTAMFSYDGRTILSTGWDGTARLWDTQTQQSLRVLQGHKNKITRAVFSSDGQNVLTADEDGVIKLWLTSSGEERFSIQASSEAIWGIAYHPSSHAFATVGIDGIPRMWDAQTGAFLREFDGERASVITAMFSPDGQDVLTSSEDHTARIWDAATGALQTTLRGHSDGVYSAAYSRDGQRIVTSDNEGAVKIWDATTGNVIFEPEIGTVGVSKPAFSPDGNYVVSTITREPNDAGLTKATVWDAQTGQILHTLDGHKRGVMSAEYSPDGRYIATASQDQTAIIWDALTGSQLFTLRGHTSQVHTATFSPNSKYVVTASADGTIKTWNIASGSLVATYNGHKSAVFTARFSPDGRMIASSGYDNVAKIWYAETGTEGVSFTSDAAINNVAYRPDGQHIVTATDQEGIIWDAQTGNIIGRLPNNAVDRAFYSPDGQNIVTTSGDAPSIVWDAETQQELFRINGISIKYCYQGRWIIASAAPFPGARIFDAHTGEQVTEISFAGVTNDGAIYVDCSPDGRTAVTASGPMDSGNYKVIVWDVQTRTPLKVITGHDNTVMSAVYSPDGHSIITASVDATAKIWDLDSKSDEPRMVLTGHTNALTGAFYSVDSSHIITTSIDGTAKIWDAQTGTLRTTLSGNREPIYGASLSQDGRSLVVVSNSGQIWQYVVPVEELLDLAQCRVTRQLTSEERRQYMNEPMPSNSPIARVQPVAESVVVPHCIPNNITSNTVSADIPIVTKTPSGE